MEEATWEPIEHLKACLPKINSFELAFKGGSVPDPLIKHVDDTVTVIRYLNHSWVDPDNDEAAKKRDGVIGQDQP